MILAMRLCVATSVAGNVDAGVRSTLHKDACASADARNTLDGIVGVGPSANKNVRDFGSACTCLAWFLN